MGPVESWKYEFSATILHRLTCYFLVPISLAIILLALCIAFLITRSHSPLQMLRIWRTRRATRQRMSHISLPRAQIDRPDRLNQPPRASTPDLESMADTAVPVSESRPQHSTSPSAQLPLQTSAGPLPSHTPARPESEPDKVGVI